MSVMTNEDLPVYQSEASPEVREAQRMLLREQLQHLVTAPREAQIWITCACSRRAVAWQMYRCLYCGVFFCKACAERHFGFRVPKLSEEVPRD